MIGNWRVGWIGNPKIILRIVYTAMVVERLADISKTLMALAFALNVQVRELS